MDREKLKLVMKKLGLKPQDHIRAGSHEVDDVYATSPVKGFKGF